MSSCWPVVGAHVPESLQEPARNALLRRADWRFLLHQAAAPRTLNLATGDLAQAVGLVSGTHTAEPGVADLAVLGRPTPTALSAARCALRPGGELYCEWRLPLPTGTWWLRRALQRAGFDDVRLHWPWPAPERASPQFWMPLGSAAAVTHLFARRPDRTPSQAALRRFWRVAARAGALAPVCALARRPPAPGLSASADDEIGALLDAHCDETPAEAARSWLLLTGGQRSINKVVALPFTDRHPIPRAIVKFARVRESEPALEREAQLLRVLEVEHPAMDGVPRVLAVGRRAGGLALAETAIPGVPLSTVTEASFPSIAAKVTRWLLGLAGMSPPEPRSSWWPRLVQEPLDEFEQQFAPVAGSAVIEQARRHLEALPDLPLVFEHRDCSPWNIVLTDDGSPALLDWESAEPRGLPGLDLVYFLANAAFMIDGALDSGRTGETYARLLDPSSGPGRVAARCLGDYGARLGLDRDTLARLRLLCWIVHCRSEYRRLEQDAADGIPHREALRASAFLGLVGEELRRAQAAE
jgi:predicted Ser/Thr protein kinase